MRSYFVRKQSVALWSMRLRGLTAYPHGPITPLHGMRHKASLWIPRGKKVIDSRNDGSRENVSSNSPRLSWKPGLICCPLSGLWRTATVILSTAARSLVIFHERKILRTYFRSCLLVWVCSPFRVHISAREGNNTYHRSNWIINH